MFQQKSILLTALFSCSLSFAAVPTTSDSSEREQLKKSMINVLDSMKQRNAQHLNLSPVYASTENGSPVSPVMSTLWKNITDYSMPKTGQWVIDEKNRQVFVTAKVYEGNQPAVLFGRIKVSQQQTLDELEFYLSRSKGESGQLFDPNGLDNLPEEWQATVPKNKLPSRELLMTVGQSVFDSSKGNFVGGTNCKLVEMGGVVIEDPEALKIIMGHDAPDLTSRKESHGVSVPCTSSLRPQDPKARVIVDTQQGISVSMATVNGMVFPSFITPRLESTFVPNDMLKGWQDLPTQVHNPNGTRDQAKYAYGTLTYVPQLKAMPASMEAFEITRYYDGQVQGVQRYMHMHPTGGVAPWAQQ